MSLAVSYSTHTVEITASGLAVAAIGNSVEVSAYNHVVQVSPLVYQVSVAQAGLPGPTGADGPAGQDGTSLRHGTVDPDSSIGNDGDFYINTSTYTLFGPKNTTWPAGVSLVGPTGPAGAGGEGSGDVVGPASATDGHIAVFDTGTGKLLKDAGVAPYSLPTATDSVLGGVKVGSGLSITDGVLSATGGSGTDAATVNSLVFAQTY